jgi:hypothetical protein
MSKTLQDNDAPAYQEFEKSLSASLEFLDDDEELTIDTPPIVNQEKNKIPVEAAMKTAIDDQVMVSKSELEELMMAKRILDAQRHIKAQAILKESQKSASNFIDQAFNSPMFFTPPREIVQNSSATNKTQPKVDISPEVKPFNAMFTQNNRSPFAQDASAYNMSASANQMKSPFAYAQDASTPSQ